MGELLPSGWKAERLGKVCQKTAQIDPHSRPDDTFTYIDVSSVSNEAFSIIETRRFIGKDAPSRARKLVRKDDVVFATVRPTLRRIAMVPASFDGQLCSTGFCVLRSDKEQLNPDFLYLYLLTKKIANKVEALQKGATYPAISDSDLFNQLISLPPISEQRAIARSLRGVQASQEARRREMALERERKAALMEHLFTHGTRGEATKQTEIGEMPESWEVARVGDFSSALGSGVTPKGGEKSYLKEGIPLIRSQNVLMNKISIENVAFISAEVHQSMIRSEVKPGDLLLNITGASIGRVAHVPESLKMANVNQHVCRIRFYDSISSEFASYFLSYPKGQSQIMGSQFGTTRQGLNYGNVRALKLPEPPISEQKQIAYILQACDSKITALDHEARLLDELFRAMLEELMSGRLSATGLINENKAIEKC